MNTLSQTLGLFILSVFAGILSFSVISSSALAINILEETIVQIPAEEQIEESYNWFTAPLYGMLASVDDPFDLKSTKIDANGENTGSLQESIIDIINYLLLFIGLLLLVIIIYAGVLIILSDGEEDAVTKGRKMIMYALIGVVIIVLSYSIVNFIGNVVGGPSE